MAESILCFLIKVFAFLIRSIPVNWALGIGKAIGYGVYLFDVRHRTLAYSNLKLAFSETKSPDELKKISRDLFLNFGQNIIELFRLPLLSPKNFHHYVTVEGKENVEAALEKKKGCILLAMHSGSWEMASTTCSMMGFSYKVFAKEQARHLKLDALLNSYRSCGGTVVLTRGTGTRDFIRAVQNNELVSIVVDQGGRDGVLVPFFGRNARLSAGAIRIGLKYDAAICFSIITREKGAQHRMIINKPFDLIKTGDLEKDVEENLKRIVKWMEQYITLRPSEYMWFYKVWKFSNEENIAILSDGKTGHLRQSQNVGAAVEKALKSRDIVSKTQMLNISFKNKLARNVLNVIALVCPPVLYRGRLEFLKWFLKDECFKEISSLRANYIISTGASVAGLNHLIARDGYAKSLVAMKPGFLPLNRFDFVFLPKHDWPEGKKAERPVILTNAAPNLINPEYLKEQSELLLKHFSHLKGKVRTKIGVLIGGDSKHVFLSENMLKMIVNQLKQLIGEMNIDLLITTSRRTPAPIEQLLFREFKKDPNCPLLILANQEHVPEAFGGILGLSDILIVSGDSVSMISEAASTGKNTIVFYPEGKTASDEKNNKFRSFINHLSVDGFILATDVKNLNQAVYSIIKNKFHCRRLNDNEIIEDAARYVI